MEENSSPSGNAKVKEEMNRIKNSIVRQGVPRFLPTQWDLNY
jgi:hypothetical protein